MTTGLKKHSHKILTLCLTVLFCFGCTEDLFNGDSQTVKGLKEALTVGVKNSVSILSAKDGYLGDMAVKIFLPQEAQTTFNAIRTISGTPGLGFILSSLSIDAKFEETLITLVNRAAEDAAPKAIGVFSDAITGMTISDGKSILFGADNAATQYLKDKTYANLQAAFEPSISGSLNSDEVKIGEYTPMGAWNFFADQNNQLAGVIQSQKSLINSIPALVLPQKEKDMIFSVKNVDTNLSDYVTGKALDGLFKKVTDEELKIRTNPAARVTDLLKDVFGQLDKP